MNLSHQKSFFLFSCFIYALSGATTVTPLDHNKLEITTEFALPEKVSVLQESLQILSNKPGTHVVSFDVRSPIKHDYDTLLKDVHVIEKSITLTIIVEQQSPENSSLTVRYQDKQSKKFFDKVVPVKWLHKNQPGAQTAPTIQQEQPTQARVLDVKQKHLTPVQQPTVFNRISGAIDNLVTKSNSLWIQLIAVFLLGIFMSLTPCIYPMIPITAGILQSYGSKSFAHNCIVSLLYSLGIATTFSLFGLVSASTGKLFGNLLVNPIFVLFLVAVLAYLALSMIGVVDMYIPRFMQTNTHVQKKSVFSAFAFGMISGSVASPCLTPGLALLLTLVATLANKFLGFVLLFTAGIGLSMPLLIVGTFSSSLSVLPRAGMWMIEIKKLFGFVLFGMCFYFLHKIMPQTIFYAALALFFFASSVYYFMSVKKYDQKKWKTIKNSIALLFIVLAVITALQLIQTSPTVNEPSDHVWEENLALALEDGKALNKKVLIDVTGQFCSICKAIERKILNAPAVQHYLDEHIIKVKIDASNQADTYAFLQEKYTIIGVPTILLIDPTTMELISRWGSQLYSQTPEQFIDELQQLL